MQMSSENKTKTEGCNASHTVPFHNEAEAWFWFIAAQEARTDGARFVAGQSLYPRPCEPLDILKVLDRLYRQRRLLRDHLLVLRHYGRRHLAPDDRRVKEARAFQLWHEALERIGVVLEKKGIIEPGPSASRDWMQDAMLYENYHLNLEGAVQ